MIIGIDITGIVVCVVADGSRAVIGNHQTRKTAEVIEGVNMAEQPVLCLHIVANLSVGVPATRKNGDKYVGRLHLSCSRTGDIERVSLPRDRSSINGLVRNARGCFCNTCPTVILLTELRDSACCHNLYAVFFEEA